MDQLLEGIKSWLGLKDLGIETISSLLGILTATAAAIGWPIKMILKHLKSRKEQREAQLTRVKRFPPEQAKWASPYFCLESSDPKSIRRFTDFLNGVDNEVIELDMVIREDEKELVFVSKEKMERDDVLASDYLVMWKPYREFEAGEYANASNSTGLALEIRYTPESDAALFYSHGCWYMKGFFTVLPGFTNQGVCSIPMRAEKVQSRKK